MDALEVLVSLSDMIAGSVGKCVQRIPFTALVSQGTVQRHTLVGVSPPSLTLALPDREARYGKQRFGHCRGRRSQVRGSRGGEHAPQELPPLTQVIAMKKESPQSTRDSEPDLHVVRIVNIERPLDRGAQVCILLLQQVESLTVGRSEVLGLGLLGESAKVHGMGAAHRGRLATFLQVLQSVLTHSFQQPEARLAVQSRLLIERLFSTSDSTPSSGSLPLSAWIASRVQPPTHTASLQNKTFSRGSSRS